MPRWNKTLQERFEEKYIVAPSGCWEWTASKDGNGYGILWDGVKNSKAHRVSYTMYKGTIPVGMFACHTCDNPACVNPEHVFIGSALDNNRDAKNKGRGHRPRGAKNPKAKLTQEQVDNIRSSGKGASELAHAYPVSRQQLSDILNNKKWVSR